MKAKTALGDPALVSASRWFDRGDLAYVAYLVLPLRVYLELGRAAGWLEMLVRGSARRAVRANLEQAFSATRTPREIGRLTRQVFEFHQMRTLLVLVAPLLAATGALARRFPLRNIEYLDRAIATGKGVIILGSHVNSVGGLLAMIQLRQRGYDLRVPMPDVNDAWPLTVFRRFVHRIANVPTVNELVGAFYAQFNVRPLKRVLDQGAILLLMGDGWHSVSFVDADLLGRRLPFTNGPLNFARFADAAVVPVFSVGEPHRMAFEFEPHFELAQDAVKEEEVARQVRHFVSRVEQRLLADIPCWQHWMEEDVFGKLAGWRDRPIGERYAV